MGDLTESIIEFEYDMLIKFNQIKGCAGYSW